MATNKLTEANTKLDEALAIRREFAEKNSEIYSPRVAETLSNLGNLQKARGQFEQAQKYYEESILIRRDFASKNPELYLPELCMSLINLSVLFLESIPNKQKSIQLAKEAFERLLPIYKQAGYLKEYLNIAVSVLNSNGVFLKKGIF